MKRILSFLTFSRSEQRGVILLLFIILGLSLYRIYSSDFEPPLSQANQIVFDRAVDSLLEVGTIPTRFKPRHTPKVIAVVLEPKLLVFDPDTASAELWMKHGFSRNQAEGIVRLRDRFGGFNSHDDVAKIKIIKPEQLEKLDQWMRFPEPEALVVKVNSAKLEHWVQLKGIGVVIGKRILKFREALGGFHSINQVCDVYGVKPEVCDDILSSLYLDSVSVKSIDINKATIKEFARHPYITFELAKKIDSLRHYSSGFTDPKDILVIPLIVEQDYRKLAPYLMLTPNDARQN